MAHSWSRIKSRGGPPALFGHSAVKVNSPLLLFLHVFDFRDVFCSLLVLNIKTNSEKIECNIPGVDFSVTLIFLQLLSLSLPETPQTVLKMQFYIVTQILKH